MRAVDLYTFSSSTLTNIWAGIGASTWAVPRSERMHASLTGKARQIPVGSCGLLYCVESKSFTTPFLVYSKPDPDMVVSDVWADAWAFPFQIHPLGTPRRQLHKDDAMTLLDVGRSAASTNPSHAFHLSPVQVFVPVTTTVGDWEQILSRLAHD